MICDPCKEREHDACRGGTWCDCQHRAPVTIVPSTASRLADREGNVRPVEDVAL